MKMKTGKKLKQKKYLSTPQNCLDQLSHHHIPQNSVFQNAFPDPMSVPSVASTALQYDTVDEVNVELLSELDVRLLPRAEDDSELDSAEDDTDPLEHAGAFTTEEVSRIYLDKLRRLKSLYTGEYKRLHYLLRENRRQYLQALKIEKETMTSVHDQNKQASDQEPYQELKFLTRYHRPLGKELLLHKQELEKRMQVGESTASKPAMSVGCVKCTYSEGSWRCGVKSVPLSKYCFKHIMQDERQVLFRPCGSVRGGSEKCEVPVIPLPHSPTCVYHTPLPNLLPLSELEKKADESPTTNPKIIDLSETSAFIISEIPPENVMEGDSLENSPEKEMEVDDLEKQKLKTSR